MPDYQNMSDADLITALENNDIDALPEACKRCEYDYEYNNREQVIDDWEDYDDYTHQGILNYTDSILIDLCLEWLRKQVAAQS